MNKIIIIKNTLFIDDNKLCKRWHIHISWVYDFFCVGVTYIMTKTKDVIEDDILW